LAGAALLNNLPLDTDWLITILTVVPHHREEEGAAALAVASEALGHCTASLATRVRQGDPAEEILREAEEHPTDLIVVGSRGCSAIARFFLGSVAERVARHAHCPVLLARRTEGGLRKLIVGVDGSKDAACAVRWVQEFPLPDCEVRPLTVLPFLEVLIRSRLLMPPFPGKYGEAGEFAEQQEQQADKQLRELAAALTSDGRRTTTELRHGDPGSVLLEAGQEHGADLIVVGSQGLSAIERFAMGSVSENVLRHAHCSVVIVR
jgi:nucleotide-binding universal stress UspA family protein